jgi:hypothetical protein
MSCPPRRNTTYWSPYSLSEAKRNAIHWNPVGDDVLSFWWFEYRIGM